MIKDVMSRNVVAVELTANAEEAARKMKEHKVGSSLVIEKNKLVGMVTDRMITTGVMAAGRIPSKVPVSSIMTREPVSVRPDQPECDAARIMGERKFRRLPVVDESGKVLGVVSITDLSKHAMSCTNCTHNILKELSH